jgi:hypothetical protein
VPPIEWLVPAPSVLARTTRNPRRDQGSCPRNVQEQLATPKYIHGIFSERARKGCLRLPREAREAGFGRQYFTYLKVAKAPYPPNKSGVNGVGVPSRCSLSGRDHNRTSLKEKGHCR